VLWSSLGTGMTVGNAEQKLLKDGSCDSYYQHLIVTNIFVTNEGYLYVREGYVWL